MNHLGISFGNPQGVEDIRQILALQRLNLPANISEQEALQQGFVTVQHHEELLADMNRTEPQIIAKSEDQVVAYALVMLNEFAAKIPALVSLFEKLQTLSFQGKPLPEYNFYVMGQVCVAKSHRGQGLFDGLYQQHRRQMSDRYDFVVTEIATRNQRSLRAHARVGFQMIHQYTATSGADWEIVLWDWR